VKGEQIVLDLSMLENAAILEQLKDPFKARLRGQPRQRATQFVRRDKACVVFARLQD